MDSWRANRHNIWRKCSVLTCAAGEKQIYIYLALYKLHKEFHFRCHFCFFDLLPGLKESSAGDKEAIVCQLKENKSQMADSESTKSSLNLFFPIPGLLVLLACWLVQPLIATGLRESNQSCVRTTVGHRGDEVKPSVTWRWTGRGRSVLSHSQSVFACSKREIEEVVGGDAGSFLSERRGITWGQPASPVTGELF